MNSNTKFCCVLNLQNPRRWWSKHEFRILSLTILLCLPSFPCFSNEFEVLPKERFSSSAFIVYKFLNFLYAQIIFSIRQAFIRTIFNAQMKSFDAWNQDAIPKFQHAWVWMTDGTSTITDVVYKTFGINIKAVPKQCHN